MSEPLFSVVMPVYNQAKYISQAVQSVVNQTIDSWELIIVDNHSKDETVNLIEAFNDPRIKLSFIDNHGVIAKSRNQGILSSTGSYIAFLDSDDLWFPTKLQEVSRVLNRKSELVYHWVEVISADGLQKDAIKSRRIVSPTFENLITNGNPIVNSSVVVSRKSLIEAGMLDESVELIGVEDYNMWLKLALNKTLFVCIPKFLGSYRLHPQSTSLKYVEVNVPDRAFKGLENAINIGLKDRIYSRFWEIQGRTRIKSGDFNGAWEAFSLSVLNMTGIRLVKLLLFKNVNRFFSLIHR